ncbi:hypothetical protein CPC08DRAFT_342768 [Agrocybe pediades]|nr:hypothetical protein CPC08DRAFT_342768 [Agrocybe pediades]
MKRTKRSFFFSHNSILRSFLKPFHSFVYSYSHSFAVISSSRPSHDGPLIPSQSNLLLPHLYLGFAYPLALSICHVTSIMLIIP